MNKVFLTPILMLFAVTAVQSAEIVAGQEHPGWNIQHGKISGSGKDAIIQLTAATAKDTARIMSPSLSFTPESTLIVRCTYRTTVTGSAFHHGAWLALLPQMPKGSPSTVDGLVLPAASQWTTVTRMYRMPAGAERLSMQIRLQQLAGTLEIKTVGVVEAAPGAVLNELNPEFGFGSWQAQKATIATSPLGDKFIRLTQPDTQGSARLIYDKPVIAGLPLELSFSFQTEIPMSRRDFGAWVYIAWMDAKKQRLEFSSHPLPASPSWREQRIRLMPPAQAVSISIQIRVQQTPGTLDLKDIKLLFAPEKDAATNKTAPSVAAGNLRLVEEFRLAERSGSVVLLGNNGSTLAPVKPASRLPAAFRLPAEFCGNGFTYELDMVLRPGADTRADSATQGLFTLGRNMSGAAQANSFSLNLWQGKMLYTRLTTANTGARAEVRKLALDLRRDQPYRLRVNIGTAELKFYFNDELVGTSAAPLPFQWQPDRPFYLGAEADGISTIQGKIENFKLRIYRRQFEIAWNGGYLRGNGPHQIDLAVQGNLPAATAVTARIVDLDGKVKADNLTIKRTSDRLTLPLPSLPFGWYQLECMFGQGSQSFQYAQAFVVLPAETRREAAAISPFGITQEFPLKRREYNRKRVETLFPMLAEAGIRWFRVWLHWDNIYDENRQYDWNGLDHLVATARVNGIELYICLLGSRKPHLSGVTPPYKLNDGNFPPLPLWRNHLRTIAEHYRGRVNYYQIWNEPDTRCNFYPFTPEAYLELLKTSYETLKAVDPQIQVGLGGFCVAMEGKNLQKTSHDPNDSNWGAPEFYRLKPQAYYDITDVHLYSVNSFDQSWDPMMLAVIEMRRFLQQYDPADHKPIWNSETSFLSGKPGSRGGWAANFLISTHDHAARLVQWYIESLAVGIQRNFWYTFTAEQSGLVNSDLTPKPAYAAHVNLVNQLNGMRFQSSLDLGANIHAFRFGGNGRAMTALWTVSGRELLTLKAGNAPVDLVDLWGNPVEQLKPQQLKMLELTSIPVFVNSATPAEIAPLLSFRLPAVRLKGRQLTLTASGRNPTNTPIKALLRITEGGKLCSETTMLLPPGKITEQAITLTPSADRLDYGVKLEGGMKGSFVSALQLNLKNGIDLSDGTSGNAKIDQPGQVKIGGRVMDSQGRVMRESSRRDNRDLCAAFSLRQEGRTVKFQIEVVDDRVVPVPPDSRKQLYEGDCVEMFLDFNVTGKAGKYQILLSPDGRVHGIDGKLPPGFKCEGKIDGNGYILKGGFALPENSGNCFGFDLALDDADDNHGRKAQMVWSGDEQNFQNTAGYGVIIVRTEK